MLDEIFFKEHFNRSSVNYIFFGFIMTLLGFISSVIIFGPDSLASILIITILLMPAVMRLFQKEEFIARAHGLKNIYDNHKEAFRMFFYLFLGIFFAFLIIQLLSISNIDFFQNVFSYQLDFIKSTEDVTFGVVDRMLGQPIENQSTLGNMIFIDLILLLLCFLFSFFYGSGGLFLLVVSASVFSTLIIFIMRLFESFASYSMTLLILFILLFIPFSLIFILVSIAGGILSKAFVAEKLRSKYFRNVLIDSMVLFLTSIVLIIIFSFVRYGILSYAVKFI